MGQSKRRASPAPFPWDEAMCFGLGVLRLGADQFWKMTPRELRAASDGAFGKAHAPLTRASLEDLMNLFPDEQKNPRQDHK